MTRLWLSFILLITPFLAQQSYAHIASKAYLDINELVDGEEVSLKIASGDLSYALQLDADKNGDLTLQELQAASPALSRYLDLRVQLLDSHGNKCQHTPYRFATKMLDSQSYLTADFLYRCNTSKAGALIYRALFDTTRNHSAFVTVNKNASSQDFVITESNSGKPISLQHASTFFSLLSYVGSGIWHILIGYDHIIFIIALLIPAVLIRKDDSWHIQRNFISTIRSIATIVTAFTVAHTFTLFMAASGVWVVNETLIEVLIAASLAVSGICILFPFGHSRRWLVAFLFGLIHGFGFAGALREMLESSQHLLRDLLAFNMGVEMGQLLLIMLVVPALYSMRRYFWYQRMVLPTTAVLVTSFGVALTLFRSAL